MEDYCSLTCKGTLGVTDSQKGAVLLSCAVQIELYKRNREKVF